MSCTSKAAATRRAASLAAPADRLRGFDQPTVWAEFTPLAVKHQAINLGQGFPDWETPQFVKQAIADAVEQGFNQYTRPQAHLSLATVLAKQYSKWMKREVCAETNVVTTVGCTEGIYMAMQGLINPGDEVVIVSPAMDIYEAQVQLAGGVAVQVSCWMDTRARVCCVL
jgi:kynurenine--oxoglutarate transaminase/cysteine-S-conjugate beta-lyase/glutamine--phenylpyruvate transaminase